MEAELTSKNDQSWQNADLLKRLTKPLLQPGIINFKFVGDILSRTRNMTVPPSPVLMRLVKRGGMVHDAGGGHLQIVNAQWAQKKKESSSAKEEGAKGRLPEPAIQYKKSASALSGNRTFGEMQSQSAANPLPTAQAVWQAVHPEDIAIPRSTASLQGKEVLSETVVQGKTRVVAAAESPLRHKESASALPGRGTSGDIESKSDGSHLPIVRAVVEAVHPKNSSGPKLTADLQMKEVDSVAAAEGKILGSTGTEEPLQYKEEKSDLSVYPRHGAVALKSEESGVDKKKISASVPSVHAHQLDNTKWKISRRGGAAPQLSLSAIQKKTDPVTGRFVIKNKSDSTSSYSSSVISKKGIDNRAADLAEDKGVNVKVSRDNMISGKTAGVEKSVLSPESILHTSIAVPLIRKKSDRGQHSSKLIVKSSFSGPVVLRKEKNPAPSLSPPLLENAKNSVSEIGIDWEDEKPAIVYSTAEQIQRAPALIWQNNDVKTTPVRTFPGQAVRSGRKTGAVSTHSSDQNMLSLSEQAGSSSGSGLEASSGNTIGKTIQEQQTGAGRSGVDLSKIADRVSRILYRKLTVERERRGV